MVMTMLFCALISAVPEVSVEVPDTVPTGEVFECKITISGDDVSDADCTPVYSSGLQHLVTSSMHSFSSISTPSGTRMSSTVSLSMSFVAYTAGEHTIGPLSIYSSDRLLHTTDQYVITATGSSAAQHQTGGSGDIDDRPIAWMEVEIDTTGRVFPGQTFQANYYMCKTQPSAEIVDLFFEPSNYATSSMTESIEQVQWIRGKGGTYRTWIATLDITPAFACTLSIPVLRGRIGLPGGLIRPGRQEYISTDGITVPVYPFPENGKPDNFSGITGSLAFTSERITRGYSAGGERCIRITASGPGTSNLTELPELTIDGPAAILPGRYYQVDDDTRSWNMLIEPSDSGRVIIGPDSIAWFDTETESYRQSVIPACTLSVYPIAGSCADLSCLDDGRENSSRLWIIIVSMMLLLTVLIIIRYRNRIASPEDVMAASDVEELLTALGDRLSLILTGSRGYMGAEELDELLDEAQVDGILSRRLLRHWKDLELLLSGRQASPDQFIYLRNKSRELLNELSESLEEESNN